VLRFSKNEFAELGLKVGSNWSHQTIEKSSYKMNRLKDFYFASPRTMREMFRDIQHADLGKFQINNPTPRDFLAAFYFLKKYPTKISQAAYLEVTEKYGLKKAWRYVYAIQALKEKKVSF
jgi:DNA polymerase III alpha subunit